MEAKKEEYGRMDIWTRSIHGGDGDSNFDGDDSDETMWWWWW